MGPYIAVDVLYSFMIIIMFILHSDGTTMNVDEKQFKLSKVHWNKWRTNEAISDLL